MISLIWVHAALEFMVRFVPVRACSKRHGSRISDCSSVVKLILVMNLLLVHTPWPVWKIGDIWELDNVERIKSNKKCNKSNIGYSTDNKHKWIISLYILIKAFREFTDLCHTQDSSSSTISTQQKNAVQTASWSHLITEAATEENINTEFKSSKVRMLHMSLPEKAEKSKLLGKTTLMILNGLWKTIFKII